MAQEPKSENQKTKAKNQDSKLPNYQVTELSMFQVTMQPSDPATSPRTEERELRSENQSAKTKVQESRNESRRTRTKEQNLRSKKPQFPSLLGGKIDQKSDFWNIVLRCRES